MSIFSEELLQDCFEVEQVIARRQKQGRSTVRLLTPFSYLFISTCMCPAKYNIMNDLYYVRVSRAVIAGIMITCLFNSITKGSCVLCPVEGYRREEASWVGEKDITEAAVR